MLLGRRPDAERFLANPDKAVRAALIFGRDLGVVRERGQGLAAKVTEHPDDPFDVALITDADMDDDPARLIDDLMALSLMAGAGWCGCVSPPSARDPIAWPPKRSSDTQRVSTIPKPSS